MTVNTFMAIPVPEWPFLGVLGSVAMVALTVATLAILFAEVSRPREDEPAVT